MDDAVKDLFTKLETLGILGDSVIIMTADHGDEFNEHGGLSHDGKMYSELIDVPLIIYDPDLHGGRVSDAVVSTIDVSPTIAHLFDIGPIGQFQGHSLLPLEDYGDMGVFGEAIDKHGSSEQGPVKGVFFYREGDLKCIYREIDDSWELYDLKADPKEVNNIIDVSADAERMKARLTPRIQRWRSADR
jgi:arylsulfatase A-like enzyme